MKKTYTIILAFIFATCAFNVVNAQTQLVTGPVFKAESDEVPYGTIKQNSDRIRVLKFKNTGSEPLTITNAVGSCGCTVPDYPKGVIMPGETSEIKINYDTNRIGPINKTVLITTNEIESKGANGEPVYKQHSVRVTGEILAQ